MTTLYGLKVSYFTGKMEGYLRYKEIPFTYRSMSVEDFTKRIPEKVGARQMPAIELADGRWMTDTSPMIDWFETHYPEPPILPADPVQAFLCRLIEDYADEWLWRPAMHFRWSYPVSATLLARQITDEIAPDVPIPGWLKRWRTERRQKSNFVDRDGVTPETRANVEGGYVTLLKLLTRILETRPFLFGGRPTLADIGLFGPLFRHFAMDPAPGVIMRETAPAVSEWVYRLWNARASRVDGPLVAGVPDDLLPLVKEIGETHLQALCANADAWARGDKSYEMVIQGAPYRAVPTSQYRVWCLEKLQERFRAVDDGALAALLGGQNALEPLLRIASPNSGYDPGRIAPFGSQSIPVFAQVRG
ncbi:MAG: glutathione S-transferase family protein [Alphaproteobacteria bacterium]|nr:glutathione S-transferase family protein [Alphaproteobacteria bacterium]